MLGIPALIVLFILGKKAYKALKYHFTTSAWEKARDKSKNAHDMRRNKLLEGLSG